MKYFFFTLAICSLLLPVSAQAAMSQSELLLQLKALQAQLIAQQGTTTSREWTFDRWNDDVEIGSETQQEVLYRDYDVVNLYRVANGRLYKDWKWSKNVPVGEQKIWDIFEEMAGQRFIDTNIDVYATYKWANEPVLGFVKKINVKNPAWAFVINANAIDLGNKKWVRDSVVVLTHEYAHILTLNSKQVNSKKTNESVCKKDKTYYVPGFGCALKRSYLTYYVSDFWPTDLQAQARTAKAKKSTTAFYEKNTDIFVTKYAASSVEEDIAESFADFILRAKPTGSSIKEKKILFFYDYPELVKVRTQMRSAIAQYFN